MNNRVYLGIDTSNYTTSIALCDEHGQIIANIKKLLNVKEGERGLRQSDAVFSHVKNFIELSSELAAALNKTSVSAIGVSTRPRDVEGSYMPCFLTGQAVAEMVSATHGVPIYNFSHQSGHIMAALYSSGTLNKLINQDFVAFHVSGGTTEALYVSSNNNCFDIRIIANTADISAGQAIDRAGVMMGLKFPCGKEMEALAQCYSGKLPKAKICVKDGKCNLSGLENLAQKLFDETGNKEQVSAFVFNFIENTLVKLTEDIRSVYPDLPIVYAGGVMSNKRLQTAMSQFDNTYFATPEFSADNAAGIALLTKTAHE